MTPEERNPAGSGPNARAVVQSGSGGEAPVTHTNDPASLRRQIRQTRSEMGETIQGIEHHLDGERLKARAEEVADNVIRDATERVKQVALEATDHAKEAAKEITDHALAETKLAVREMTGQATTAAREATIGKVENMAQNASQRASGVGSGVVDMVTRNPMAAALAGIGLGWLLLGNRSGSGSTSTAGRSTYYYGRGNYSSSQPTWTGRTSGQGGEQQVSAGDKFGEAQAAAHGAIDQVQETAGEVAGQAQELARDAGSAASDVGSSVLDTIQQNPLPTLVAAASIGYLLMNRPGMSSSSPGFEARYRSAPAVGRLGETADRLQGDLQDSAGKMANRVQETTGRVMGQAQDTIDGVGDSLQFQAMHTQHRFEQFFGDHPLVAGAAAVALGVMAGLPVPQTQQEHDLMGQTSDRLIDRAQSVAQQGAQKLQHAVEQSTSDDEIRRRTQEVADKAKEAAQNLDKPA